MVAAHRSIPVDGDGLIFDQAVVDALQLLMEPSGDAVGCSAKGKDLDAHFSVLQSGPPVGLAEVMQLLLYDGVQYDDARDEGLESAES